MKLVVLVQFMWYHRTTPTELGWTILILGPKVKVDTRRIGILEVQWKVMEAIIDTRTNKAVTFHDVLYRFFAGGGTETAIVELKPAQDLESVDQDPLFLAFLEPRK